jgi:post-segregation antitoxin (ccd killing protein)
MMSERQVRKRAVNLCVDTELLDEARRLHINLSETIINIP